jgi:Fic family protein
LSRIIGQRWLSNFSGPTRNDKRGCDYESYVPDDLTGRAFVFDAPVVSAVVEAEAAISRLNADATSLVNTESLARMLLRAESVASSRIEGLEVGPRRLLRAEVGRALGEAPSDVTAVEVLANIEAMMFAIDQVAPGGDLSVGLVLEVHRRLLAGTRLEEHGGRLRQEQNWIGGSSYNPCGAAFVPPPPEYVPDLIEDLVAFCNDDALPAVAQAAIAHAQFETIHPFVDGNGRTGRALVQLVLRCRGTATRVLPPVSLVLATWAQSYVGGLTAMRYRGSASSPEAVEGTNRWVAFFAEACVRSVKDAFAFEQRARGIEGVWRNRLGRVRANSATDRLLYRIVGAPVLTVGGAAALIGRSFEQTNAAIERLTEAGILSQVTVGRRNRAFEAPENIDAFADLERQLASPQGDTGPARRHGRCPAVGGTDFRLVNTEPIRLQRDTVGLC